MALYAIILLLVLLARHADASRKYERIPPDPVTSSTPLDGVPRELSPGRPFDVSKNHPSRGPVLVVPDGPRALNGIPVAWTLPNAKRSADGTKRAFPKLKNGRDVFEEAGLTKPGDKIKASRSAMLYKTTYQDVPAIAKVRDLRRGDTEGARAAFHRELTALQRLKDVPNVVQLRTAQLSEDYAILAIERMKSSLHTRLLDVVSRAAWPRVYGNPISVMHTLSAIVLRIHRAGVAHLAINPAHILINPNLDNPKFSDFFLHGFSSASLVDPKSGWPTNPFDSPTTSNMPEYVAPEVARGLPLDSLFPVDVYALGVVLYQVYTSLLPDIRIEHGVPVRAIKKYHRQFMPSCVIEILDGMLDADPAQRWTVPRVVEALRACAEEVEGR